MHKDTQLFGDKKILRWFDQYLCVCACEPVFSFSSNREQQEEEALELARKAVVVPLEEVKPVSAGPQRSEIEKRREQERRRRAAVSSLLKGFTARKFWTFSNRTYGLKNIKTYMIPSYIERVSY